MRRKLDRDEVFRDANENPIDKDGNPVGTNGKGNYYESIHKEEFFMRPKSWPKPPPSQRPIITVPMSLNGEDVEVEVL